MTEAVLLVGGQGTRLRPLTVNTPKPMLPVAGVPFTVHQITRARDAGIQRIVLATSYRAEVFAEFVEGVDLGIDIVIATEDEPLGTGGAIRHALSHLESGPDDPIVIFNGDVLSGLDIDALVRSHVETSSHVTLYLTPVEDPRAYGLVPIDGDGRVEAFLEKPSTPEEIVTDLINAGCYVFTRSIIEQIPAGRVVSVERETFPGLLAHNAVVRGVVIAATGSISAHRWRSCKAVAISFVPHRLPRLPTPVRRSCSTVPMLRRPPMCGAARRSVPMPLFLGLGCRWPVVFDEPSWARGARFVAASSGAEPVSVRGVRSTASS